MQYTYRCPTCGHFQNTQSIHEDIKACISCPTCGILSTRDFRADLPPEPHYNSQGFHRTDYDRHGDKLERLNRDWSKATGEAPPPPSTKVPKSSSEVY